MAPVAKHKAPAASEQLGTDREAARGRQIVTGAAVVFQAAYQLQLCCFDFRVDL